MAGSAADIAALIDSGELAAARRRCRAALRSQPRDPGLLVMYAGILQRQADSRALQELLRQINELFSEDARGLTALAGTMAARGLLQPAAALYAGMLEPPTANIDCGLQAASIHMHLRHYDRALQLLLRCRQLDTAHARVELMLGACRQAIQQPDAALEHYRTSWRLDGNSDALAGIANILHLQRRDAEARQLLSPHIDDACAVPLLVTWVQATTELGELEAAAARALQALDRTDISDRYRSMLHFSLGRIRDRQQDYGDAFEHYRRANALDPSVYDREATESHFAGIRQAATRETLRSLRFDDDSDRKLVFIVGMPRSGTSLVEQVLASHADVFGAGELGKLAVIAREVGYPGGLAACSEQQRRQLAADYLTHLSGIDGQHPVISDKMPDNFLYLGLIQVLFPDARIIHCRRNAADTCLSCYFQQFSGSYPWAGDLDDLAHYYRQYHSLMQHWQDELDVPLLDIDYEAMVTDKEEQVRRLLEFCGLEWDERCLQHHRTDRTITTASSHQAGRAIYRDSLQRYRHYGEYIAPLLDLVRPG